MGKRKKVLIIDDDPAILDAVRIVLEDVYDTQLLVTVNNVDALVDYSPDCILLDIFLSGQDGRDISKILRTLRQMKNTPIIMMSAHPLQPESLKKYGANDFLAKPFDINILLKTVQKNIRQQNNKTV